MNEMLVRLAVVAMAVLLPYMHAHGGGNYSFKHIDNSLGLSSSNVKCIVEDSYGFVWLGTKNGLHRYDGIDMRRLNCFDYEAKQGNNNIAALYEDEHRRLWVGTDRGVYIYDPRSDRFGFVGVKDAKTGIYADNWVQAIDGDGKGNVWVLLPDLGVFRYHGGRVEYFPITLRQGKMKENVPSELCVSSDGEVWVATAGAGLWRYDARSGTFRRVVDAAGNQLDGVRLAALKEDSDGSMVLAATDGRLFRYSQERNMFERIPFSGEGRIYLRCFLCFDDEIWVGSSHGLYILNKAAHTDRLLLADSQNPFSLSDNIICCMYESGNGDAWIGTSYGGANYVSRNKFKFSVYGKWSGITGRVVSGLVQAGDNSIWVGTEDDGIFVLDPSTGRATPLGQGRWHGESTLFLSRFNGLVQTGFPRVGLVMIDSQGHPMPALSMHEADNSVYSYLKDSRGNEWVGLGYALYRRDEGKPSFVRINETGYDWIFSLFEDHRGTVWIGTMGNGIWRYTPSTGRFKRYIADGTSENGLRSNSISSFMEDSRGDVWVSTDRGGICRYNSGSDDFTPYGTAEGLPDDVAYNMLDDGRGNLWFGTNKGLVRFNPQKNSVRVFTVRDGLPHNQFNYNAAIRANDGTFYFGGIGGVVAFNPDIDDRREAMPAVYFTRLSIYNREVTASTDGSPLDGNIMFADKLRLPYGMSTFSLNVVAPSFGVTGGDVYSYKLEPVNTEWIHMADNHVSFANLPPGVYRLCVKAERYGQVATRELGLVVCPPWWRSLWAYLVYIVLAVVAFALWFKWYCYYKERQLRERQRLFAVSKEKELYEKKVRFFTEVAHEIRTPLTLIDAPLEAIEEIGIGNKQARHYLSVTRQNTKRLLNLTGQLLDFQKIDANKLTFKYENVDICVLLGETVARFEPSIMLKGKTLQCSVPDEPVVASTDREAVTKIMSNLLNNALKYARSAISVALTADEHCFTVSVKSDGSKICGEDRQRIFERFYRADRSDGVEPGVGIGLPLSSSLASLLGGSLVLADNDSDGNVFSVTVPLNKEGVRLNNNHAVDTSGYLLDDDSNQANDSQGGYTVLIVEDNDSMREFLADQVGMAFTAETARNGREALEKLAQAHVDIVVTDVMMPVMDGFELCLAVKADINMLHVPVVFITAKNDLDSKIRGLQMGAEAYVEKPFSVKYLRQLLGSLLDNRRRERDSFYKKPFFGVNSMHITKADEEFMNKVVKIIEDNMGDDKFNVELMADMLCMSHSSLLRKIKSVFSMSPVELIRTVKLKKAAGLIQDGRYLISDICYMVGMSSPSYFSKLFFRQFGISPKDFEKQCRDSDRGGMA